MHRLVQASCHVRMSSPVRRHFFKIAIDLLKRCWPVIQSLRHYYDQSRMNYDPLIPDNLAGWDFPRLLYEASWYVPYPNDDVKLRFKFFYERGMYESMPGLLKTAKEYCLRHTQEFDHALLEDIYDGIGSLHSMTNHFQGTYENFRKTNGNSCRRLSVCNRVQRPTVLEVFV